MAYRTDNVVDTFFGNGQWVIAEDANDAERLKRVKWMNHVPMPVECPGDFPERLSLEELLQMHVLREQLPLVAASLGIVRGYAVRIIVIRNYPHDRQRVGRGRPEADTQKKREENEKLKKNRNCTKDCGRM